MVGLTKQYQNDTPKAYYAVTAFWGIAVYDIIEENNDTYVVTAIIDEGEPCKITANKIEYLRDGTPYFRKCGLRIRMEDVYYDNL